MRKEPKPLWFAIHFVVLLACWYVAWSAVR